MFLSKQELIFSPRIDGSLNQNFNFQRNARAELWVKNRFYAKILGNSIKLHKTAHFLITFKSFPTFTEYEDSL
jgi:hypothetical protein